MKTVINYVVDTLLTILFLAIGFIGVLMGFFIPRGSEAPGYQKVLWGVHRHAWGDLHLYFSLAFAALVIVHLVLHWDWLGQCARRRLPKSLAAWLLVVALGAAALVFVGARLTPPGKYLGEGAQSEQHRGRGRGLEWELTPQTQRSPAGDASAAEHLD
jgi:hypothetical protein